MRGRGLVGVVGVVVGALFLVLSSSVRGEQPKRVSRIGYLGASASSNPARTEAFRQGLRELGYVEGQTIVIEYRWAEGKTERLVDLAAELVSSGSEVIFTYSPQYVLAVRKASPAIPIVFVGIGDPVATGIVASLARPGGNTTGLANFASELSRKRLELLKESAPRISSVAVLWNGMSQGHPGVLRVTEAAAGSLGLKLQPLEIRTAGDFDAAFQAATKARAQALLTLPDPLINAQLQRIVDFAAKSRLPAIYAGPEFVEAGGLMSYAPDYIDQFRRAATYVDKILKGAKPGDLPVEQPAKFELVINMKTAKTLGLTFSPSLLRRADRVIE